MRGKILWARFSEEKKNPVVIFLLIPSILVWVIHLITTKLNITFNLSYLVLSLYFLYILEVYYL